MSRTALLALVVLTLAGLAGALFLLDAGDGPGDADPVTVADASRDARAMAVPEAEAARSALPDSLPQGEPPHEEALRATVSAPVTLLGRVVDRAGTPRPDASVSVLRALGTGFAARLEATGRTQSVDAEGRFELHGLPSGEPLVIQADDADAAPTRVPTRALQPGEQRNLGDLVLGPGLTLVGRVSDEHGQPLPDAIVSVREGVEGGPPLTQADCDADGRYRLPNLAPLQYGIRAACDGHATMDSVQAFVLGPAGPDWTVDFTLPRADRSMAGLVTDAVGTPLPDVGLRLLRRLGAGGAHSLTETRSGPDGHFLLEGLPDGLFDVSVDSEGYYLAQQLQLTPGDELQVVRLHPASVVHGHIQCSGRLPASFVVSVKPDGRTGARVLGGQTRRSFQTEGELARFTWEGLRPGAYSFLVEATDFAATRSQDVILGQGQPEAEVVIELRRGGSISGRIDPPTEGVRVELRESDWDPASPLEDAFPTPPLAGLGTRTDESGRFHVAHVPEGGYVVTIRADGLPASHRSDVQVLEDSERDLGTITLAAGGIVIGRVLGPDGRPRAGANVRLSGDGVHLGTSSDADGSFVLDAVPAGHYEVGVIPGNLSEALVLEGRAEIDVRVGEQVEVEVLLSERPRRLR